LILCAGLILRIALIGIDSYFRFKQDEYVWKEHVDATGVVSYLLIFNPMIIFTLPVFAVTCDWTDALVLLNNDGQIDRD
jgi:hypothetical protein